MAINSELIKSIAFEIGIIATATIATFIIPGLGGIVASGAIQFLGDFLGIELTGGDLSMTWFLTEFLTIFNPFFEEFKAAKLDSKILRTVETGITKAEQTLQKIDDALFSAIEKLKTKAENKFSTVTAGVTPKLESEIKQVEQQEIAREKFGTERTKITKKINSFTPNTKNQFSWIAGVGFKESIRLAPRDIRGSLIIIYYVNNESRVGFRLKQIRHAVLGRTSGGAHAGDNKKNYHKVTVKKDMGRVKTKKVIFKGARYYGDYLAFLKSHSWGGYYMRRWMVGEPGRKGRTNGLILFGSIYRVWSKLKSLTGDAKSVFTEPGVIGKAKASEFFGQTRLGSQYNKVTGFWAKGSAINKDPFAEASNAFKARAEQFRDNSRERNK